MLWASGETGESQANTDVVENTDTACLAPRPVLLTKSGKVPSRRDCHKCPHCGRIISGSVTFKGEKKKSRVQVEEVLIFSHKDYYVQLITADSNSEI